MQMTREGKTTQSAALVVISSVLVNPVFGWSFTMLLDNLGLVGCKDRAGDLGKAGRWIIQVSLSWCCAPLWRLLVCSRGTCHYGDV